MARTSVTTAGGRTPDPGVIELSGTSASARRRLLFVLAEVGLVLGLLLAWVLSEEVRRSTSLWVLFFYSFPAEFLVGLVPHEPVLLYYGAFWPALTVALVSAASTVVAEGMNYSVFGYLYDRTSIRGISDNRWVRRTMDLFDRAPMAAVVFAGLTPVPFFPVRFLVVMTGYPLWRYMLGVALGRTPRFYLLALFGGLFEIPTGALMLLFLALLLSVNVPALVRLVAGGSEAAAPEAVAALPADRGRPVGSWPVVPERAPDRLSP